MYSTPKIQTRQASKHNWLADAEGDIATEPVGVVQCKRGWGRTRALQNTNVLQSGMRFVLQQSPGLWEWEGSRGIKRGGLWKRMRGTNYGNVWKIKTTK